MKHDNRKRAFADTAPKRVRRNERREAIRRKLGFLMDGMEG